MLNSSKAMSVAAFSRRARRASVLSFFVGAQAPIGMPKSRCSVVAADFIWKAAVPVGAPRTQAERVASSTVCSNFE